MRKNVDSGYDIQKIEDFLQKNNNEFFDPISNLPGGIKGTIDLCLEKGQIIITEQGKEILGLLGITHGEPSKNFANIDLGYLYLLIIDKNHRHKKDLSLGLLKKIIDEMKNKGINKIRFKTSKKSEYNNKLYKKMANIIGTEINTAGIICNLYETDVDQISDLLNKILK